MTNFIKSEENKKKILEIESYMKEINLDLYDLTEEERVQIIYFYLELETKELVNFKIFMRTAMLYNLISLKENIQTITKLNSDFGIKTFPSMIHPELENNNQKHMKLNILDGEVDLSSLIPKYYGSELYIKMSAKEFLETKKEELNLVKSGEIITLERKINYD